ncbi:UDP-4-amino-4,6-dideoxy-N-acetyl-beta-L-altrosamine transaminase [Rhizobium sp. Root708]|uniref:UDP-4-amino-4, 6-dideoxy-N-acetyl-beta-L-altrosamine transaminase n=1 Tax=Rhizobium sp. Root708 TaxID=1736592 RepID=UPI0006FB7B7D|nr:UDP-4-amino-4,6-dideoxy-N-acetyl-beta-L-altrosamine transaminase [Rhizobium sp. Root708]KRB51036.1 UDP-4-amino-4,6-dideoxy-N-acetyl-beta-L-altrosamine transaminase [Rhizobium sp. Root708]
MIPYGRQDISQADIDFVIEVLKSDFLTQGPLVGRFEEAVASYCGTPFAVALNSATSALHVACLALELGPGDVLWTSPTTFVASANCALYCGAGVDFVDIDPKTYNMSVERLAEKLAEAEKLGKLPKVVVPVHLSGQPCDMPAIKALADRYGFKIIEDASHAVGARYRTGAGEKFTPVGDCRFSDITVFSFHPVKIVTTGEGGMALTKNPLLADRLQRFRSHGITSDREQMVPMPDDEIWNYQQILLGYNYRLTDIQAALGISQMSRIDGFIRQRHKIAERYDREFANLSITTPWQSPDIYSSYHLYVIRVRDQGITQRKLYDGLQDAGVNANLHYIPVYRQPYFRKMGFERGYCPEAEAYFTQAVSIPMYPTLTDDEQGHVINVIANMCK